MVAPLSRSEYAALQAPPSAFVARAPYNDRFQYRLGSALTPQALSSVQRQADNGYLWQWIDVLDELRETDPHLHAVLYQREALVAGAAWQIVGDDERVNDYVTRVLSDLESRGDMSLSFTDLLHHMQTGVYYGRAVAEVIWSPDGRRPEAIEFVHARRLAYATDWRIHLWDATGSGYAIAAEQTAAERAFALFPGVPLDIFPSGKFIVHRPRVRGGYPTREGIGRTVCWYALFKKFGMRDLLALTEWAGRGLRVGEYSSGSTPDSPVRSSPEDVTALQEAIEAMSSTVSIVIPDTTKLTVLDAPNVNALHEHLVALCNGEMSKAVVGSTLAAEVGENGGNRALGEVHERVTLMIARGDAEAVAATLRRDLLRPMVERMFGRGTPCPKITFATDPAQDLTELAKRLDVAVRAGVNVSQRDAREMLQLPEPQEGDALLVPR